MKTSTFSFECLKCHLRVSPQSHPFNCTSCGGEIYADYNLDSVSPSLRRDMENLSAPSILRFRALLPMQDSNKVVTMYEGGTPLLPLVALGKEIGLPSLYGKDETRNPTHSFKDRPMSVAVSVLNEMGASDAFCVSGGGNTGSSAAAYCARAGIRSHIFVPATTPIAKVLHILALGADLRIVQGTSDEVLHHAVAEIRTMGYPPLMTRPQFNPYSLEGCKTMAFEIAEQMRFDPPDFIVIGVGTGTNLAATWKGLVELRQCSVISRVPKLIAVQTEGAMPLVNAFNLGLAPEEIKPWPNPHTIATGIGDSFPDARILAMRALKESGGMAVSVKDEDVIAAELLLARKEGVFAEPAAAASIAGAMKLANSGSISKDDRVVCAITGSGLKQLEALYDVVSVPATVTR